MGGNLAEGPAQRRAGGMAALSQVAFGKLQWERGVLGKPPYWVPTVEGGWERLCLGAGVSKGGAYMRVEGGMGGGLWDGADLRREEICDLSLSF